MCDGLNTTRVRWLNPKGNVIEDKKGRVHVEEMKHGIIALVFELISLSDKDNWTCQAETGDHKISFKMIVYQPISFMDTPIVQTARENSDATIRCEVKGDPEPSISWYYNGQMINLPNQKYSKLADGLLIKKVQRNDSGEYTCKAFQVSSTISNVKEQTIRLKIQHKPLSLTKKATADVAYGYLYGIVNLTCEAEAEPAANFTWLRNHKQLNPNNNKIYIGEHISVLQLLINDSKKFGDYKCKAQNMYGTFERTITLNQGVKPNKPTKLELRGLNSDRFDIDVGAARTTSDRTDMDINGYRFELIPLDELKANGGKWDRARVILVGFEDGITYLINDLTPNTTYYVRVAARNPAGLSDWQGPTEFRTNPANLMVQNLYDDEE